jgi:hypothetical protein
MPVLHWSPEPEQSVALPPLQLPAAQVSPSLQKAPSSQLTPSLAGCVSQAPVPALHVPVLHWSPNPEQSVALPPAQAPVVQVSPVLHRSPSSQLLPSLAVVASHVSVPSLQVPVLHWSPEPEQSVAPPPPQLPAVQVSPSLQKAPSLQEPPSFEVTASQASLVSLQVPVLHWSPEPEQSVALPPLQLPAVQVSPSLQKAPSSQLTPSLAGCVSQAPVPALHTPVLHWSPNPEQSVALPAHTPPVQVSPVVQASLSSQDWPSVHDGASG